ncbi:MAG: SDR family NAD(P)-dependent oxidoreductase [Candidatus Omnitrophota bacterium]|nr:SDR family NAD(P)-dependent oxidoreductase [Candidatus Omnitrophota bacterium]
MTNSQEKRFTDKVVAVTGSARGIGKNIAAAFAGEGAFVFICDINTEMGKATEDEFRNRGLACEYLKVDLAKSGAAAKMVQEIVKRKGCLDVLVNNARSRHRVSMLEETEESWEQGMAVTLKGAFFASQEAIRVMSERSGGSIVNISSVMAEMTCHESPVYHIAKAGVSHMTRYFATHGSPLGVRVNAVVPGFIVQDENRERYAGTDNKSYREVGEFTHPVRTVGKSDDVAYAVLFLASTESCFITGQCLVVDGGATLQEQNSLIHRFSKTGHEGLEKAGKRI